METQDAIIAWLEQGNNFVRVTTVSSLSSATGRDRSKLARAESQALKELTTFVNLSVPRTNWDAKYTRLMLNRYLIEYRSTTAANLQLSLDEKDKLRGYKTVQDKLNKCRHFQRLEQLHERFAMEENPPSNEPNKEQQTTDAQLQFDLTDAQRSRSEKDVVPKKIRTEMKKVKKTNAGLTAKVKKEHDNREEDVVETAPAKSAKNKQKETKGKSQKKTKLRSKSKKQPLQEKNAMPAPLLIVLSSDDEEDKALPVLRRSTRSKRRASISLEQSTDRSADASLWIDTRKLRHVESASATTGRVCVSDVTPTQTTQIASSAFDGSQGSAISNKNTPSGNTPGQASGNKQRSSMSKPAQLASSPAAISRRKRLVKDAVPYPLAKDRNPAPCSQKSTQITSVPTTLRPAIAQAVSQQQQLLSRSQSERCQRSTSESDYDLSDIDLPNPSASCNDLRSSDGIRHEARPSIGLLPSLVDRSLTTDGRANLERKRVFLQAKRLAFEQLKWQSENKFRQQELELLRYEMEAREALAQQELRIKGMRIRAAIIQPMVSAGASVADIVERLRLL